MLLSKDQRYLPLRLRKQVIHHPGGDVHAGGGDAVAELHGVVHLVHQQPVRRFQEVDRQQTTAKRPRRVLAGVDQRGSQRAVGGDTAARGVGDPVFRYNAIQAALAGSERVFEIMDTPVEVEDAVKQLPLGTIRGDVRFENVVFGIN